MLRKEIDEFQLLKAQVQELSQEVAQLKEEVKTSKEKYDLVGYDSGKGFGKVMGRAMMKQSSLDETFGNKQVFNQLVKAVSYAMRSQGIIPGSFGGIN